MTQKLGWLALVIALALPAAAGDRGSISGIVKNSSGVPQMGAKVQVFGPGGMTNTAFTDAHGLYTVVGLAAGMYQVKVSAPSFLPALRDRVSVRSGAALVVNVTLNTLFEALQWLPVHQRMPDDDEDWKWTLRSMVNRPVLRMVGDGPAVVTARADGSGDDRSLRGKLAFLAGPDSEGFGSSAEMTTAFSLEHSMFSAGTLSLDGNVGYNAAGVVPGTVLRASYSHRLSNGSEPKVALTVRRFSTPDIGAHSGTLQALELTTQDTFSFSDVLELNVGSNMQAVEFMGHAGAISPFGSVNVHLSPNTVLEYRYASSVPNMRAAKGFDSAPADLSESGPRMSLVGWNPVLERGHHQEVAVSRRIGANKIQVAYFWDRIANPALTGIGDVNLESGDFLSDIYSGTFTYTGSDLDTNGLRVVYQRKLLPYMTATVDYAFGGVLDVGDNTYLGDVHNTMSTVRRHALACKMSGNMPGKGQWMASYGWTSGPALTPVDVFNAGPGQTDAFLNIFVRQPIPGTGFMPGHMEALIDLHNLLAQGYVPMVGQDSKTVYLVQSARTVRGGVAFTF